MPLLLILQHQQASVQSPTPPHTALRPGTSCSEESKSYCLASGSFSHNIICYWDPNNLGTVAKTSVFQQLELLFPGDILKTDSYLKTWVLTTKKQLYLTRQITWESD